MNDLGGLGEDKFISANEHESWLDQFSIDHARAPKRAGGAASEKDSYPHFSYDTLMSAKEERAFSKVDMRDSLTRAPVAPPVSQLMSSAGVAIFAGLDSEGQPAYGVDERHLANQPNVPWLNAMTAAQKADVAKELQEQKLARTGSVVKPEQAGLLVTFGRFISTPIQRVIQFVQQWAMRVFNPVAQWAANTLRQVVDLGRRLLTPILAPVGRFAERAVDWSFRQVDRAQPYVKAAVDWVGQNGKKVLDTLIIDAPKAAIATVRGWLERLSNWLGS